VLSHSIILKYIISIKILLLKATLQKSGSNLSQTDASVAVVEVSGTTHIVWRIMYPQCNRLRLQHVCRSHNAFRTKHPIGIYTQNTSAPGWSIIHPIAIYTHNLIRIIHPIAIYTHSAMVFVLNVCTAPLQCHVSCVLYSSKIIVEKVMHITSEYEERLRMCQYVPRLSFGVGCWGMTVRRTDFSSCIFSVTNRWRFST